MLGMETTESCEGGRKWLRPSTPLYQYHVSFVCDKKMYLTFSCSLKFLCLQFVYCYPSSLTLHESKLTSIKHNGDKLHYIFFKCDCLVVLSHIFGLAPFTEKKWIVPKSLVSIVIVHLLTNHFHIPNNMLFVQAGVLI